VTNAEGTTLISEPKTASYLAGPVTKPFVVTDKMLAQDFGSALKASPDKPTTFLLQFEAGGSQLTAASQQDIPKIIAEVARRAAPDVSIIGHTDTTGSDEANLKLGLTRAKIVAGLLSDAKLDADHLSVQSHGKKNNLVRTMSTNRVTVASRSRCVDVNLPAPI
jgi:peptidoglycan-associated lipoprotein